LWVKKFQQLMSHRQHGSVVDAASSRHQYERDWYLLDSVIHTDERVDAPQLHKWSTHNVESAVDVPRVCLLQELQLPVRVEHQVAQSTHHNISHGELRRHVFHLQLEFQVDGMAWSALFSVPVADASQQLNRTWIRRPVSCHHLCFSNGER